MKLGLAYDLKQDIPAGQGQPEDHLEEYDSIETVDGIASVLGGLGHEVVRLGGGRSFLTRVLSERVDFVFNIAEGRGNYRSREAQVPSVLEMLDIPYAGSDPQCLAVCLDKPLTNRIVKTAGVRVPQNRVVNSAKDLETINWNGFPFPAFIKPAHEGSSKGVRSTSKVDRGAIAEVVRRALEHYHQPIMVEEFIAGEEVTVGTVGNPPAVIGIMRVVPRQPSPDFIYSLAVKRDWENIVDYECPAKLPPRVTVAVVDSCLKAFQVLGCRDFARMDFRILADGTPVFLEVNPLPGLNSRTSDLCILAGKAGWSYARLIEGILGAALDRYAECILRR